MHDDPNSVMEQASQRERSQGYGTCSHCYAPIQARHSGLRHFGTHTAHQEYECLRILHARIAELERERDVTGNLLDSAIAELQKYKRGFGDE